MSTYVIGDLQGCHAQLCALLTLLEHESPNAQFIFVGDLVNRGPASLATLREIRRLGARARMVLGNHDLNLLAVAHGIRKPQPDDTMDDILQAPDCSELLDWLRHQPLALECAGHLIVHAGVNPAWSVAQTLRLAHEVEAVLQGPDWLAFLPHMYGSQPARWDETLTGTARLRCILNSLTRMRYCSADGSMDFSADADKKGDRLAWFEVPGRAAADTHIVFGHWSALGLTLRAHVSGLDTGCVWVGKLSAMRLEDRAIFQVDCPQYQQPDLS